MKTLAPITIGAHTVTVTIEDSGPSVILFTAKCGETTEFGKMNLQGPHDHPPEQFQKDVDAFATRLASLAAGKENSRKLKASLFSEGDNEKVSVPAPAVPPAASAK